MKRNGMFYVMCVAFAVGLAGCNGTAKAAQSVVASQGAATPARIGHRMQLEPVSADKFHFGPKPTSGAKPKAVAGHAEAGAAGGDAPSATSAKSGTTSQGSATPTRVGHRMQLRPVSADKFQFGPKPASASNPSGGK